MKDCLCKSCKRICKIRNDNCYWCVIECNAFVKEYTGLYDRVIKDIRFNK